MQTLHLVDHTRLQPLPQPLRNPCPQRFPFPADPDVQRVDARQLFRLAGMFLLKLGNFDGPDRALAVGQVAGVVEFRLQCAQYGLKSFSVTTLQLLP